MGMIDEDCYKRIQEKKKELEEAKKTRLIPEDFKREMMIDYIYNTLALEGSSLTREQVRKIVMEK